MVYLSTSVFQGNKGTFFAKGDTPTHIDIAPSSAGKCSRCRIRIVKGTIRSWYSTTAYLKKPVNHPHWNSGNKISLKRLLCFECTVKSITEQRNAFKTRVKGYSRALKKIHRLSKNKKVKRAMETQDIVNALEK